MERKINPLEASITESVVQQLIRNSSLDLNYAGQIQYALTKPELVVENSGLNIRQAKIAKEVVEALRDSKNIPDDAAKAALSLLEKPIQEGKKRANLALKAPIEKVGELARDELSRIIEYEKTDPDRSSKFTELTVLEKAVFNMETLDGWVEEGTFLQEYMSRRSISVKLCRWREWGFIVVPYYSSVYFPYTSNGVCARSFDRDYNKKLDVAMLEEYWDEKLDTRIVRNLALLNRGKFAEEVLKKVSAD
jgi:hypothetical protein